MIDWPCIMHHGPIHFSASIFHSLGVSCWTSQPNGTRIVWAKVITSPLIHVRSSPAATSENLIVKILWIIPTIHLVISTAQHCSGLLPVMDLLVLGPRYITEYCTSLTFYMPTHWKDEHHGRKDRQPPDERTPTKSRLGINGPTELAWWVEDSSWFWAARQGGNIHSWL